MYVMSMNGYAWSMLMPKHSITSCNLGPKHIDGARFFFKKMNNIWTTRRTLVSTKFPYSIDKYACKTSECVLFTGAS